jgi:hypothetical protein
MEVFDRALARLKEIKDKIAQNCQINRVITKLERRKGSKHVVMTFSGFTEEKDLSYDNWG